MEQKLKDISLHLLDLGKRNRLINYKSVGYRNIEILNDNFEELFEKITNSTQLSIFQLDPVLQKYHKTIDGTGASIEEYSVGKVKDIASSLLKSNDLLCYKKGISLNKIVKALYREYKNTLLEKGINTLYMTFGMVEYEEKKEHYLAPLLLIPLDMDIHSFKVKEHEDEIILNPTLAYLLETEFKIVLEEFRENEITIQEYLSKISFVLNEHKMKLHYTISIGIYSFLKMNMFNDLRNHTEIILQNQNILKLLGSSTLEEEPTNEPIYPVVDADESQLSAIHSASNGESFVLQGPPGTGKSQTITNMIASLIGNGKKVLFVSEKQAALNVVYENLKRAGLESFAIELHSHKANKKEFIEELYKTAILPRYEIKHDAEELERKYAYLETILEEYREKLHQKISRLGMSMYEVYSAFLKLDSTDFLYKIENIDTYTVEDLNTIQKYLDQYCTLSTSLGYDYKRGPFYGFTSNNTSYIRYEAKKDFESIYSFYKELNKIQEMLTKALPFTIESYKHIVDAMPYLDKLIQINYFLPEYFVKEQRETLCQRIEKYKKLTEYISKSTLKKFLDLRIIQLEGFEDLVQQFEIKSKKIFKFILPSYHQLKKTLSSYAKLKMKDEDLLLKLKEAIEYKNKALAFSKLKKSLPAGYRSYEYDIIYSDAMSLKDLPFSLNLDEEKYQALKTKLIDISFQFKKNNTISLAPYIDKFDSQIMNFIEGDIKHILLKLKDMIDSLDLLETHAQRLEVLQRLKEQHALPFIDQAIENKIGLKKLSHIYEQAFWQANILYETEKESIYKEFSGLSVENIVEDFKQLDQVHLEANKAYIISKLSNCRPDESIMVGSKFSILVREYNKSRKHKPIRLLLEEIFDLILDIKPVFLMSPLSVSTYLNSKLNLFDAVIFDEASQVFAWDALGAIYRAKQCIVIGDSKQMPPSNFFTSMVEDDEDYENDMESILDKGSSVFKTKRLNWHYRSRSEELIAFSNQNFYDNRLITIPQAKQHSKGFGIDFHYVMGTYEVKARINKVEANTIADLVFEHAKTRPNLSLGVVAFSNAQADFIADLIEERLDQHPELRAFFDDEKREPFFVKNLESVQGDERDVIIFSICFGYTAENKFYQRFGPLNNLGGERRLNVAVTRAKENVCVVSSIHASDIKLDQTESVGVAMLKKYLEYAEGASAPKHASYSSFDGVISSITQFLNKAGYMVQTHIGASAFKIDIAVLDKETNTYSAAIMVDGSSYQIGNCSDANALQEKLLTRLGWRFLRVFSTEWIFQEKLEKERILQFLRKEPVMFASRKEKQDSFLVEIEDTFDDSFISYSKVSDEKIIELYNHQKPTDVIQYIISKEEPIHKEYLLKRICFMYGRTKVTALVREYFERDIENLEIYKDNDFLSTHPIVPIGLRISSDRSIEYIHTEELKDAIYKIVKKSNGITKEGCFKKVVGLIGYNRMSDRAIEILEQALVFLKLEGKLVERQECLYV
ncbi:MAG: DUF4011 domain-containing protein [Anaeroplasmataceae bacterium]|nr:DUF4011 domain-containing protein [Anaeroplasmataceae bacterium]